jgi:hypothetical protein
MRDFGRDMDIAKNIKLIEWLKTELLDNVSTLFRGFAKGGESILIDSLANIIVSAYVLGKRIGIQYHELDRQIAEKVRRSIEAGHQVEDWYGDLSLLENHVKRR